MITFDDARELVELEWPRGPYAELIPAASPFVAAPSGGEDSTHYLVHSAKPMVEPGSDGVTPTVDAPVIFVEKSSGIVTFETFLDNMSRVYAMTEVRSAA